MSIRYAIFDLDHTLIRSENMHEAWKLALAEFGVEDQFVPSWVGAAGRPLTESAAIAFGGNEDDERIEPMIDSFWVHVGEGDPQPIEGAQEILDELQEMGIRLFLSTGSYPIPVARWLDKCGWTDHFELILPSSTESPKGAEHYRRIVEHVGVPLEELAAESLTVGDGHFDMKFGLEHNVAHRIGYAPLPAKGKEDKADSLRESGANAIIRDLHELPRYVERINAQPAAA